MAQFTIGFEISGHLMVEAPSELIAATKARALVRAASNYLEATGETDYRCPFGQVVRSGKAAHAG